MANREDRSRPDSPDDSQIRAVTLNVYTQPDSPIVVKDEHELYLVRLTEKRVVLQKRRDRSLIAAVFFLLASVAVWHSFWYDVWGTWSMRISFLCFLGAWGLTLATPFALLLALQFHLNLELRDDAIATLDNYLLKVKREIKEAKTSKINPP